MDKIIIRGGAALKGTVALSGSKNATLPIMMAAVLTDEPVLIHNVPRLRDVSTAIDLLAGLGVEARWTGDHDLELCAPRMRPHTNSSKRCARHSSCWGRCWRARAAPVSRRREDARSARAR